jgi:TonB-linked SusC/RagA family outer membrane protein
MRKFLSLFAVLVLLYATAFSQTKTVTGKISDQQNQPVPFASIRIKGTKSGVSADVDGRFSIRAKTGDLLIVTGTGVTTKEVPVDASIVEIQVTRKESNLTEVVVTALGVQRQSKELGYSTAKVSGKDLNQAKPISAINGLTGKVSGLQINTVNNGLFAPTRVTLRGNRSLTGNNQPLYVVDGAIFNNDINTLNPDDIVDITVLKGSSASAVYGSDASNGVIIITTKKGTRGKASVTVSSTVSLETVAYMPAFQSGFGSSGGEQWINDFNDLSTMIPYENQAYGPHFRAGTIVPIGRVVFDSTYQSVPYTAIKNQKKDFFNKAVTTQNNFSYSAGDENGRFYISGQDIHSNAVMPGDYGRRDAFRVGGSKTYGVFSADYSLSYTYLHTNKVSNEAGVYDLVLNTPADIPLTRYKDWRNNKFATLDGYYNDYYNNPYWTIGNDRDVATDNNISGNVHLGLKLTSWLNLSYRLSMNNRSYHEEIENGPATYSTFASTQSNLILYSNYAGNGVDSFTNQGLKYNASLGNSQATYTTNSYNNFLVTSDFFAAIDKNLSKNFNLKATLGTTYVDNKITDQYINAGPLFFPVYNVNSLTGIPANSSSTAEARKLGYFGEATIGYKEFAFLHGSYRTDIDSRLSKENRYIPYYDIDGSLVLSDIFPTIAQGRVLNFLKVTGAHSLTGNVSAIANGSQYIADGAYATVPTLYSATGLGFPYNGVGGYALNGTIANPNIKPEKVTEDEIGIDIGMFSNKVSLKVNAYQSKLKDGIVYAQIPTSSGFSAALVNAANTENKGIETDLGIDAIKTRDISWHIGINYTHNVSKVITINGGQQSLALTGANGNAFAVVNQPYPVIESHDWVKDAQGHVIVDAVTGMPKESSALTILGQATPKDILGFTTSISYHRFSLAITADYRGGYKIFNAIGENLDFTGNGLTSAAAGRQRFVMPNSVYSTDGGKTYVTNTNVTTDDGNFVFWPSLYNTVGANYVVSADAWKLREVSISYDIPKTVFGGAKFVQKATFILSGRNLLMLRPNTNKWTDPEFSEDTGNDVGRTGEGQSPPTRVFSATLSIQF